MARDHGASKSGNFSRQAPEVVERQEDDKEQATQRVNSRTVQNNMRNVLRQMTTSAA